MNFHRAASFDIGKTTSAMLTKRRPKYSALKNAARRPAVIRSPQSAESRLQPADLTGRMGMMRSRTERKTAAQLSCCFRPDKQALPEIFLSADGSRPMKRIPSDKNKNCFAELPQGICCTVRSPEYSRFGSGAEALTGLYGSEGDRKEDNRNAQNSLLPAAVQSCRTFRRRRTPPFPRATTGRSPGKPRSSQRAPRVCPNRRFCRRPCREFYPRIGRPQPVEIR